MKNFLREKPKTEKSSTCKEKIYATPPDIVLLTVILWEVFCQHNVKITITKYGTRLYQDIGSELSGWEGWDSVWCRVGSVESGGQVKFLKSSMNSIFKVSGHHHHVEGNVGHQMALPGFGPNGDVLFTILLASLNDWFGTVTCKYSFLHSIFFP